jgi:NodT family efflux transporter outer membrane factor (OMF) lipoprotein
LAGSALALALAGCAVGPKYQEPSTPAASAGGFAAAPLSQGTSQAVTTQPPPDQWWELYQDPAINGLVQEALVHNTDLRVAAANLAQARGALLQARAAQFPTTQTIAGATYGVSSTAVFVDDIANKRSKPVWSYAPQFDASYEVDLWGRVRRAVEAARQDVQSVAAAQDFVRVTVAAETTRAYVDACAYAEQIAVAKHSLDLVTQTWRITEQQLQLGAASDFDLARAATLVEQTRAALPPLEDQRRAALYQLAVLTGQPPEKIDTAAAQCSRPPQLATPLPVGDGAALLRRRPDVREAERNLAAAVSRVGVAVASLYPTVTLGGGVGGGSVNPGQMFTSQNLYYTAGPLISWSFPNLIAQEGQVAQAKAAASGALAQFDGTVLKALQDAETALSAYAGELDRREALQTARDQAMIAFRLAGVRYQGGEASYLDLLSAEQTLVGADQALAASNQALASDQVSVFKALGGGWQGAPKLAARNDNP